MGKGDKENKDRIELTEMFMAQADNERCFYGIIKRGTDENSNPFVFSRIVVNDGLIQASAPDQWELGKNLDKMCIMILDGGLHNQKGKAISICNSDFFLN
jgi:hypothetical protein